MPDNSGMSRGKEIPFKDATKRYYELPRWVMEALKRVTSEPRVSDALDALDRAAWMLNAGRFGDALHEARRAKEYSPRDPTIREVIGISAYRLGEWKEALGELRTFRRLAGDNTHLPVEIDVLRALGRNDAIERAWIELISSDVDHATRLEGIVVYGSYLLDRGRVDEARAVATPTKLLAQPESEDLRQLYVAARAAAGAGDLLAAKKFYDSIVYADPSFPGLDALTEEIDSR